MRLIKTYILFFIFHIIALAVCAEHISEKEAEAAAKRFFSQFAVSYSHADELELVWNGEDGMTRNSSVPPAFYVFNRGTNHGFVIISGSSGTAPVIGYSLEGSFKTQDMPLNVRAWMRSLREHIRDMEDRKVARKLVSRQGKEGMEMGKTVDLGTPDWNQESPYNLKCPVLYGKHCYTGCAVTATAITMGYHQWPDKGTGTIPSYISGENKLELGPIQLGGDYRWDKMPDINGNVLDESDQEQADAISTLMFDLGVMLKADYSITGTGATLFNITSELPVYMKYKPKMVYLKRSDYTDEEWNSKVKKEIDAKRPVIYEGFDGDMGHAFVVDGYNEAGYLNINWGWGGYNNGFYLMDDMTSQGSGIYNLRQAGIFGVEPQADGYVDTDNMQYIPSSIFASGLVVKELALPAKKGDECYADAGIVKNFGTNVFNGTFKLAMTDHEGNIIEEFVSVDVQDMKPATTTLVTQNQMKIQFTKEVKPGYRLRLVFNSGTSSVWKPVVCDASLGVWEVVLNDGEPQQDPPIDESTSLRYEVKTGKIIITTLEGVEAGLKEQLSGKDYSSVLVRDGHTITIERKQLEKGAYILRLSKGKDLTDLLIRI